MKTYNDLLAVGESEHERIQFILDAIRDHQTSEEYKTAIDAIEYSSQRNVTINRYRKMLYKLSGEAVPDNFSANHKCASNFFNRFVTQEASHLLGNGVIFENDTTKEKLGKDFDNRIYDAGKTALVQGTAFGFYNKDRVVIFGIKDFVPLYDEEDGALKAGIRFWRLNWDKPLRATLYELDGYTEYKEQGDKNELLIWQNKRPYIIKTYTTDADGTWVYDGRNYPTFPIVPLWGNRHHQSELVGIRENIDCYDLIKSGFANDLDDASQIYWTLKNTGGMDDVDLVRFIERMKTVKAAVVDGDDGADVTAHTIEVPYQSREAYLTRLEDDMYNDFMALNVSQIAAGNITATQIMAAYEPLNNKVDEFEYCVIDFIQGILAVAGIEDKPSFKRSYIVNQTEQTEMIMAASSYLDEETLIRKLPFLTDEEADEVLRRRTAEDIDRFTGVDSVIEGSATEDAGKDEGGDNLAESMNTAKEVTGHTLNGAQTQSLISVMMQLSAGTLTEGQAVAIIATAIGVSKDEARAIIRGE